MMTGPRREAQSSAMGLDEAELEVGDLAADALADQLGDNRPVTALGLRLEAQQGDAAV